MQITFSFRNVDASDAVRSYASEKVARLQRFLRAPLTADVTISVERHLHVVDISVLADGGRFAGREGAEDLYSSIDLCLDKIDRQVRESKGVSRKRG